MEMLSEAEFLNSKFAIKDSLSFQPGVNGLTKAVLYLPSSSSYLEVYLHGAHITSWTRNQKELFFMSNKAVFEKGKALRGGIPFIFPQFGPGKIQNHGFARNVPWEVVETKLDKGEPYIIFQLKDSPATREIWTYNFEAKYKIHLSSTQLHLSTSIKNTSPTPFDFTIALHTYFNVSDIKNVYIAGLKDISFIDKVKNGEIDREGRQLVVIGEEVDRVYVAVENQIFLVDKGKTGLRLDRTNLPDVVVWNPWAAKAKALADLGEETYHKFVCVEVGKIATPAHLEPGQEWTASHSIDGEATASSL